MCLPKEIYKEKNFLLDKGGPHRSLSCHSPQAEGGLVALDLVLIQGDNQGWLSYTRSPASASLGTLAVRNAVEHLCTLVVSVLGNTHVDATVRDRGSRHDIIAELVFCDELEFLWVRPKNKRLTFFICSENVLAGENR